MFKVDFKKRIEDKEHCAICLKEFNKDDEIREVFDKAFGGTVKICKSHYFFEEDTGNAL